MSDAIFSFNLDRRDKVAPVGYLESLNVRFEGD